MTDPHEARLKRLAMRSWRRGTKEMDLILGPYADAHLASMQADALELYERLLAENDQDIYPWMTGVADAPPVLRPLVADISAFARARHAKAH
ncbi:succinate dehydrogenase assembly factor 2 [Defluviimonas sp. WL0002]|uniref:FAD assembly factor SdhE n=1 Tax=Albidovulum marisflavi TaxID=2984159 RepID=A0ABT2ZAU2_9RHOB|nr:succinate dehydrogenase assembly factor 2 [Defluviimonas sp. WL0002]MCV2868187.1 succinate dehydrogenase assembly factor 2 [Defluviimonas sp. WL0002]